MSPTTARYGSWRSPITADLLAKTGVSLSHVRVSGDDVLWVEGRPQEAGRAVIVRRSPNGTVEDLIGKEFNARSRVHEYGGGAVFVHAGVVFFTNFADQRVYRFVPGESPHPIVPESSPAGSVRYADLHTNDSHELLFGVRESHKKDGEPSNDLVCLCPQGSKPPHAVAQGNDFYSNPRVNPDGSKLAWLAWDHPNMPWDGSELWVADLSSDGELTNQRRVAGGETESIFQPEWSPEGVLHFVSDRNGWWNLYALTQDEEKGDPGSSAVALAPIEGEFGYAQWVFGMSRYTFVAAPSKEGGSSSQLICSYSHGGVDYLGRIIDGPDGRAIETFDLPYTSYHWCELQAQPQSSDGNWVVVMASSPKTGAVIVRLNVDSGELQTLKRSIDFDFDPGYISRPQPIEFPTDGGKTAHAFFFPPANKDFIGPKSERPPLIVLSHGGPTSRASMDLSMKVQYWTSRGFAVVDVNYGGSIGFGREYRERLNGQWGVVDTADCVNAARSLLKAGRVDGDRMAIRGGSAGGYTTLCALVFHDVFSAGASHYGVADLTALFEETHKFESRYTDRLIGPYPESKKLYDELSPIHHADQLSCPVILFQGLEDKVVPPAQAEAMVEALESKGLPYAYLAFEGEGHGFRRAETVKRVTEGELYFYSKVFGFDLAEEVEPITISNFPPA